jgi:hypothetical protein
MEAPVMSAGTTSAVEELAKVLLSPVDRIRPGESLIDYYERLRNELESKK